MIEGLVINAFSTLLEQLGIHSEQKARIKSAIETALKSTERKFPGLDEYLYSFKNKEELLQLLLAVATGSLSKATFTGLVKSEATLEFPAANDALEHLVEMVSYNSMNNELKTLFMLIKSEFSKHQSNIPTPAGPFWNVPYPQNNNFTGREEMLADIRAALEKGGAAALSQPALISGLGGIGKTQTALEYAYRHREGYRAVFWALAESASSLTTAYASIARLVGAASAETKESDAAALALSWLNESQQGWLLILDNADTPAELSGLMPTIGRGHVLVTSRTHDFVALQIDKPLELLEMPPQEAREFLLKRAGRAEPTGQEAASLDEILRELDGLPLALEQAGAYLRKTKLSLAHYLAQFREYGFAVLEKYKLSKELYPHSVLTTWAMNIKRLEDTSPASVEILRLAAFLHSEGIGYEIFLTGSDGLGEVLAGAIGVRGEAALLELLVTLEDYSLIRRDHDKRQFDMHRLVQAVLRETMGSTEAHATAQRAVVVMNDAFPDVEFANWPLCERLVPHAQSCLDWIVKWGIETGEAARLLNQAGYYLKACGRYSAAELLFERALAIYEKALGTDHPDTATSLNNLAELYRVQGRYADAEPLYERALAIREKTLGHDHPNTATSLNNLAGLYYTQGGYADAEPLYVRALAITQKALGHEHPNTAASLNNLAELYRAQGRYADAEPLYKRALAIWEKALGPDHPDTAQSLNNLAALYYAQGRYADAEPLYKRALAIREKALGPDHPDTAQSLNNLAELYRAQGRYSDAEPLYERALAIREKALGHDHPDTATSLNNLAALYYSQGKLLNAEPLIKQTISLWVKALGPNHPNVALALKNYADLLSKTNREEEAAKLRARAQAIRNMKR